MTLKIPAKEKTYDYCLCGKQVETRFLGKVGICPRCKAKKVACMTCYHTFWVQPGEKLLCPYCQLHKQTFLSIPSRRGKKRLVVCPR